MKIKIVLINEKDSGEVVMPDVIFSDNKFLVDGVWTDYYSPQLDSGLLIKNSGKDKILGIIINCIQSIQIIPSDYTSLYKEVWIILPEEDFPLPDGIYPDLFLPTNPDPYPASFLPYSTMHTYLKSIKELKKRYPDYYLGLTNKERLIFQKFINRMK